MTTKFGELQGRLNGLIRQGDLLLFAMADKYDQLGEKTKANLKKKNVKLPSFQTEYDTWYTEALQFIKQIIPDRLDDFTKQYKNEKRKEVTFLTYTISDFLIGLQITRLGEVVVKGEAALVKLQNQCSILESGKVKFESKFFDIQEVLQADIFDSELEAAKELCKKGFLRGAGAISGVVLEAHLSHVCEVHGAKSRKANPSISDFNDLLKKTDVIDTPQWRRIQHLGDLRNLCDHKKDRNPTKNDVNELIEGVDKVIKTLF